MTTFREKVIGNLITESSKSIHLTTTKSPVAGIDVLDYGKGRFGIISFSMQDKARKFLTSKGFEVKGSVLYPAKSYKTKEDLVKDLEGLFGIEAKFVSKF